jgi:hypothetical protein
VRVWVAIWGRVKILSVVSEVQKSTLEGNNWRVQLENLVQRTLIYTLFGFVVMYLGCRSPYQALTAVVSCDKRSWPPKKVWTWDDLAWFTCTILPLHASMDRFQLYAFACWLTQKLLVASRLNSVNGRGLTDLQESMFEFGRQYLANPNSAQLLGVWEYVPLAATSQLETAHVASRLPPRRLTSLVYVAFIMRAVKELTDQVASLFLRFLRGDLPILGNPIFGARDSVFHNSSSSVQLLKHEELLQHMQSWESFKLQLAKKARKLRDTEFAHQLSPLIKLQSQHRPHISLPSSSKLVDSTTITLPGDQSDDPGDDEDDDDGDDDGKRMNVDQYQVIADESTQYLDAAKTGRLLWERIRDTWVHVTDVVRQGSTDPVRATYMASISEFYTYPRLEYIFIDMEFCMHEESVSRSRHRLDQITRPLRECLMRLLKIYSGSNKEIQPLLINYHHLYSDAYNRATALRKAAWKTASRPTDANSNRNPRLAIANSRNIVSSKPLLWLPKCVLAVMSRLVELQNEERRYLGAFLAATARFLFDTTAVIDIKHVFNLLATSFYTSTWEEQESAGMTVHGRSVVHKRLNSLKDWFQSSNRSVSIPMTSCASVIKQQSSSSSAVPSPQCPHAGKGVHSVADIEDIGRSLCMAPFSPALSDQRPKMSTAADKFYFIHTQQDEQNQQSHTA